MLTTVPPNGTVQFLLNEGRLASSCPGSDKQCYIKVSDPLLHCKRPMQLSILALIHPTMAVVTAASGHRFQRWRSARGLCPLGPAGSAASAALWRGVRHRLPRLLRGGADMQQRG